MFWSEPLKVVLATIHVPLAEVPAALTRDVLDGIIELTAAELPRFGLREPRLALAGLNPHAGEDGLLGGEEEAVLQPAVVAAKASGRAHRGTVSRPTRCSSARHAASSTP
jgi:4-hydroxythreonine-4-phosphate dehydrogenase